jgi:hypothetical protein
MTPELLIASVAARVNTKVTELGAFLDQDCLAVTMRPNFQILSATYKVLFGRACCPKMLIRIKESSLLKK